MVVFCPECDEYAFATRIQDQPPMICRACRYFRDDILDEEGFDTEHEINDRAITPAPEDSHHYDEEKWDWEAHEP